MIKCDAATRMQMILGVMSRQHTVANSLSLLFLRPVVIKMFWRTLREVSGPLCSMPHKPLLLFGIIQGDIPFRGHTI